MWYNEKQLNNQGHLFICLPNNGKSFCFWNPRVGFYLVACKVQKWRAGRLYALSYKGQNMKKKQTQYHMWRWWVHCLSDFNSRSGDKVFLSLSPDLLQLWAKQVFSPCFWCSSFKMNWTNLNDHNMNWYYSQVRAYIAPGCAIWPVRQYQFHAWGKPKILILTGGSSQNKTEKWSLPSSLMP